MTAYFGITGGIPWAYLITAISLTFGGVAAGLVGFQNLRSLNTTKDRLHFNALTVMPTMGSDGVTVRLTIVNSASFPMEFGLIECTPVLEGRTMTTTAIARGKVVIPQFGQGFWDCGLIAGTTMAERQGKIFKGTYKAKVAYGKPGKMREELILNKTLSVKFDGMGNIEGQSAYENTGD